jgi:PTS system mannose-specific IIA component
MIGIVIVTHGNLADEFVSAMQHVVGLQEQVATACIGPNDDMNNRREDILTKVNNVDTGDGVIVLTDMFGGTPSNLAISIMDKANIEVIAGVNLPMLVKLCNLRKEKNLKDSAIGAKDAGIKYITIASGLLGN